jgi:ribulose-phosphate 3-epimerase
MGAVIVQSLRRVTRLPLEVHLMISDPELFLDEFVQAGSDSFLVHWEGNNNLHRTVERIRSLGKRTGVAINPATPRLCWSPGFGHQKFIHTTTLPKIGPVRPLIERRHSERELEVDGGIDATTAPLVVRAGATALVAGSAIFGDGQGVASAMNRERHRARREGAMKHWLRSRGAKRSLRSTV